MSNSFSELDQMMGFDPDNQALFAKPAQSAGNPNIYRTSPKNSKSEDGHYHARVRLLYNPFNKDRSIIHSATYNIRDNEGYLTVRSMLGAAEDQYSPYFRTAKQCPIFKSWKALRYSDDPAKNQLAQDYYKKTEADYILVQVLEDENQPDMVGKFAIWKLPQAVRVKLENKMKPSKDSKKVAINMLDFLSGRALDIDVTPGPDDKQHPDRYYRETKYDLCEFDVDVCPIMNVDSTPLFTDEEIETIAKYDKKLTAIGKMQSPEEKKSSMELLKNNALYTQYRELMKRAYEYLKENAVNLETEVDYQPWDEDTTRRVNAWIAAVAVGKNPAGDVVAKQEGEDIDAIFSQKTQSAPSFAPDPVEVDEPKDEEDDLPF